MDTAIVCSYRDKTIACDNSATNGPVNGLVIEAATFGRSDPYTCSLQYPDIKNCSEDVTGFIKEK